MNDLRITLVQAATCWHDPAANRAMYGELVRGVAGRADLVVLPETLTSGFTNETLGNAEGPDGESARWFSALARETGATLTGSMVTRDGDRYYNRLYWMRPDGSSATYDKRHLFRFAGEHLRYAAGGERLLVEINGWRVCPLVCYDLRFPVYLRNRWDPQRGFDYDLMLFVANWPSPRHHAWQTLLRARAIENLSYVAGVNRTGTDGNQLNYLGGSAVLGPQGLPLVECGDQVQVVTTTLSATVLAAHRERFPFQLDADEFSLRL
jgi:predicted amidohydrolase